ncbi:MAG: hypothetical protein AAGF04_00895 [Chlamydiota bacterium]
MGEKSQTIVDGLEIEKQAGGSRFFRDIFEKFNPKQILLTRLRVDLLAFGILGYLTQQFLIELTLSFAIPRELQFLYEAELSLSRSSSEDNIMDGYSVRKFSFYPLLPNGYEIFASLRSP